ncbi:MAG: hypothetical protein J6B75_09095 [Ruminococcus sp.]|nr:hypothetical protein [Ruminococcus sp.]
MQLTINRMRELLFAKDSEYCKWNKKGGKSSYDPFLGVIFGFLDTNKETQKAFQQILYTESSHDNFCRGSLRSDGYYPVKAINEWIYADLKAHNSTPDNSQIIQELQSGYKCLIGEFISELTDESRVFTELMCIENCFDSGPLYSHLQELMHKEEYLLVLAWMTVIAVFPQITSVTEKKPDYAQLLLKELFADQQLPTEAPSLHSAYEAFLKEKLEIDDAIEEVIIVHNHGLRALLNQVRHTLLRTLIDRAASVKILITEHEIGEIFTEHIRNQNMLYLSSYMPPVLMWRDFCKQFPDKVTLHLSPIPAIHQYTELKFKNSANTCCFVGFYLYGGTAFDKSPFMIIPYGSAYYSNFRTEFEYTWRISHPYTDSMGSHDATSDTAVPTSAEYVDKGIEHGANGIDLAFHAGAEWLMVDTKLAVISKIIDRHIPCRVLINDEESVQNVIPHMRSENKAYVGLTQNIRQWSNFQKQYPDIIQVKVSHIPLLHAYYHVQTENDPSVRLAYYSYDNATMHKNFIHIFERGSAYYDLYTNEFEYLWKRADDIHNIQ